MEISLRAVPAEDLAEWHRTGRQPLAGRGLRWHPDYPGDDTADALGMLILGPDGGAPPWGMWQILVSAGDGPAGDEPSGEAEVIGDIGFHGPPDPDGMVEIGYNVVPGWRRRGVASRAVGMLVAEAAAAGARTVTAEVVGHNPGSSGSLRSNGFTQVAQHGDAVVWARTAEVG